MVGLIQGPCTHYFYLILDRRLPGVKLSTIAKKIILDQMIASPFCIVLFFVGMNYLNDNSFEQSKKELKEKFLKVFAVSRKHNPSMFNNFAGSAR